MTRWLCRYLGRLEQRDDLRCRATKVSCDIASGTVLGLTGSPGTLRQATRVGGL